MSTTLPTPPDQPEHIQPGDRKVPENKKGMAVGVWIGLLIAAVLVTAIVVGLSMKNQTIEGDGSDYPAGKSSIEGQPTEGGGAPLPTKQSASAQPKGDDGVAKIGQTVTYEDGLKISVTKLQRVSGGAVATVKITNGTQDPFDAEMVSVNASWGPDGVLADCCPGTSNADDYFSGKILAGRTKTATFGFAIPRKGLTDIVLEITQDLEDPAIFEGSAS